MFNRCDFLMGENDSIVIAVPNRVPKDNNLTLVVYRDGLMFYHGDEVIIGDVPCEHREVLKRLVNKQRVGLIEVIENEPTFPVYIAAVANVTLGQAA